MEDGPTQSHEDARIVSQLLVQLCWVPDGMVVPPASDPRPAVQELAADWQQAGIYAEWGELHGALRGVEEGRVSELLGRMAAAGEQLGLAWTMDQELQRWYAAPGDPPGRTLATRALAEMCGYYLLSAAHGLANLTLRTLALNKSAARVLARRWPKSKGFAPFLDDREAWPPFTRTLAYCAVEAGTATGEAAVTNLGEVLVELAEDERWNALERRRHDDYHRWRPQSLPGGSVPRRSLWHRESPGTRSLAGGADFYDPVDHRALAATASAGLDALAEAMHAWDAGWPYALKALGVPILKTES